MLEWNVYYGDFNAKCIKKTNIFSHRVVSELADAYKQSGEDRVLFEGIVKRVLSFYYLCKCEWEVVLSGWPLPENFENKKIDVYDQIMMNRERFMDYLWDHRYELE